MKFDVKELEEIYLKSLSLDERIALLDELKPSEHESIYNERLKRWKNVFSRGGDHYFEQRLRWSGITKTQLQKILCDAERTSREDFAPPPWIPYLQKLISFAQRAKIKSKATYKYIYDSDPIPFEDLLIPFVELAEEELKCKITRASYNTLAKGAKCDLKRSLLKKLFEVSAQTFLQEFYERQDDRNAYYKQYIHWVRRGGYREIFLKYPVLAKLVSTCSVFWVNNSVELISRFNKDMFEIQDIFLENRRPLEKVTHIETDLSDPHNCGKAVNIIWFSGTRIVYKPRNLATEQQFYRFVTWLNKTNKNSDLKVLKTIDKKKYGWVEYIQ